MSRVVSLVDFVESRHPGGLRGLVQEYVCRYPDALPESIEWRKQNVSPEYQVEKSAFRSILSPFTQPLCCTCAVILTECMIREQNTGTCFRKYFAIGVGLNLLPAEQAVVGPYIRDLDILPPVNSESRSIKDVQFDKNLLPVLYNPDYDMVASAMLDQYYPEAKEGVPVRGPVLAQRMGLKYLKLDLCGQDDVYGLLSVDQCSLKVRERGGNIIEETVPPFTIVLNSATIHSVMLENSTLVHECVHMYLDRHFFLLQKMAGVRLTAYAAKLNERSGDTGSTTNWMERQAKKLPAYILLEKDITKKTADEYLSRFGGRRSPARMRALVSYISGRFCVSRSMAKYRLVQLGYQEAEGVLNYLDGQMVPDHGCAGEWKKGVTYSLSMKDAAAVLSDPAVSMAVSKGAYRFVEHHFCLDHPKYLKEGTDGILRLTDYARSHIDECCLAFAVNRRQPDEKYRSGAAAREKPDRKGKYTLRHELLAEPGTARYVQEQKMFLEDAMRWGLLEDTLPHDFNEALKTIMKALGVTQNELSERLGIDNREVYRLRTYQVVPLRHVIGVCVALQLPYTLSLKLVELSGNTLRYQPVDHYYKMMLLQTGSITVEQCNEMLSGEGMQPLYGSASA